MPSSIKSPESKQLLEMGRQSSVFIPTKRKRSPSEEDLQIRDWITELLPIYSEGEVAKQISKKLGKRVSIERVKHQRDDMIEEARANFKTLTSYTVAVESREKYLRLQKEGWKLVLEAETIEDPARRQEVKLKGMEFIRKSQESEDQLYKLIGLHKEEIRIGYSDITNSPQWKTFQNAMLIFIRYVLKQDPQTFINFIQEVSKDPNYLDNFISTTVRYTHAQKVNTWRAKELLKGNYVEEGDPEVVDIDLDKYDLPEPPDDEGGDDNGGEGERKTEESGQGPEKPKTGV